MINIHTPTNEEEIEFGLDQNFGSCEGFIYECVKCNKINIIRSVAEDSDNIKVINNFVLLKIFKFFLSI